jgi:hypothetical protein
MITTRENRSTRRETCPSANSSTTNHTWTGLRSNLAISSQKTGD